ncbi:MAG TPA: NUDIX hydrolase [Thermoanaerobaculia bacterium]|nr:NUDIX hydrolase [Thermoanaerobaculia bacterium]
MKTLCTGKRVLLLENDGWEYVERKKGKEAVAIVAVTHDGRAILTEQFRRPVQARVIDWPAGLVGDEDDAGPQETARRELKEETGYECDSVELLARATTSPGITSEIVTLYRAVGVRRVGGGGGVGGENIEVHAVPRQELEQWLQRQQVAGKLIDMKVWAGLHF